MAEPEFMQKGGPIHFKNSAFATHTLTRNSTSLTSLSELSA